MAFPSIFTVVLTSARPWDSTGIVALRGRVTLILVYASVLNRVSIALGALHLVVLEGVGVAAGVCGIVVNVLFVPPGAAVVVLVVPRAGMPIAIGVVVVI